MNASFGEYIDTSSVGSEVVATCPSNDETDACGVCRGTIDECVVCYSEHLTPSGYALGTSSPSTIGNCQGNVAVGFDTAATGNKCLDSLCKECATANTCTSCAEGYDIVTENMTDICAPTYSTKTYSL
jgi:hypothetical protein